MRINVSNKTMKSKEDSKMLFKGLRFEIKDVELNEISDYVGNGYLFTYFYNDEKFNYCGYNKKENYRGTEYIIVDIDACEISPIEFIKNLKYKPTFYHTTFSNLTDKKEGKYCFHMFYVFNTLIEGEDKFNKLFYLLTEDYREFVDKCADDCHRLVYSSNKNLNGYQFENTGIIYDINDFDLTSTPAESHDVPNIVVVEEKVKKVSNPKTYTKLNLTNEFKKDLYSMSRVAFLKKYMYDYPYVTETLVPDNMFSNGYADLRGKDFYQVPSEKVYWSVEWEEYKRYRVGKGKRDRRLFIDGLAFSKIIGTTDHDYLVYLMVADVYKNFDNADNEFDNNRILLKASQVLSTTCNLKEIKRAFKLDKQYWLNQCWTDSLGEKNIDWLSIVNKVRKMMKDEEFGSVYDIDATLEENMRVFKNYGICKDKRTLIKWLEDNGIDYITENTMKRNFLTELYNTDNNMSCRTAEEECKKAGIKCSKSTINRIFAELKSHQEQIDNLKERIETLENLVLNK